MTTRYRATLAYDGAAYQGFQRQLPGIPSIQASVETAINRITGQTVTVTGAGRTDTGVHARGQVITFDVLWRHDVPDLLRAINAVLPDDIALQDLCVQPGFHPRFDARSRLYSYTVIQSSQRQPLLRQQSWRVFGDLDMEPMLWGAGLLIGEHDFATFGNPPQGNNTVRRIFRSEWQHFPEAYGARLLYTIQGNAFLHHMVRRIVGMLVDLGRGLTSKAAFEQAFRAADLAQSGTMAPPQGLVLEAVFYED